MRAIPSPTERTVPTSETCASASKFAIWSRMTREISAARMSIVQLAFHRGGEPVEFGADRGVDLLAAQLDDDSAQDVGVDRRVDRHLAAGAGAQLCLERGELIVVEGMRGDDLGRRLAAMLGGEPAVSADDLAQLILAAVAGEDAEEAGGDRVKVQLGRKRREGLGGLVARHQRAGNQLGEILRIQQRLADPVETLANRFDLPLVAGEVEQGRRVAPC